MDSELMVFLSKWSCSFSSPFHWDIVTETWQNTQNLQKDWKCSVFSIALLLFYISLKPNGKNKTNWPNPVSVCEGKENQHQLVTHLSESYVVKTSQPQATLWAWKLSLSFFLKRFLEKKNWSPHFILRFIFYAFHHQTHFLLFLVPFWKSDYRVFPQKCGKIARFSQGMWACMPNSFCLSEDYL